MNPRECNIKVGDIVDRHYFSMKPTAMKVTHETKTQVTLENGEVYIKKTQGMRGENPLYRYISTR